MTSDEYNNGKSFPPRPDPRLISPSFHLSFAFPRVSSRVTEPYPRFLSSSSSFPRRGRRRRGGQSYEREREREDSNEGGRKGLECPSEEE